MALLARCRRQEPGAWRELYQRHFTFVFATARRLGLDPAEAEDVAHDAFLVAFRKLDQFKEGKLTTWLYRIVANITSERHRRRRVREAFARLGVWVGAQPSPSPEHVAALASEKHAVERVLARMKPKKREVLALFELEGLSGPEIAERLGCSEATVWTRLHYARQEFAELARALGLHLHLEVER